MVAYEAKCRQAKGRHLPKVLLQIFLAACCRYIFTTVLNSGLLSSRYKNITSVDHLGNQLIVKTIPLLIIKRPAQTYIHIIYSDSEPTDACIYENIQLFIRISENII